MSRKRLMFEIELPHGEDGTGDDTFPEEKTPAPRRGPMATAISETADTARERARIEDAIRSENDALAQEHVRLKQAGLITDLVPLDVIDTHRLIRDRAPGRDFELAELVASIRDLGLSNPIRVEPGQGGRYELIQGWRRLSAYRALLEETGDAVRWGAIPAGIVARGAALDELYRRMVDENMVRKDISFGEMAQLALRYAMDSLTEENDPDKAVAVLYRSAGYQKRTYIRKFILVVEQLGDTLRFTHEIPRALGLALSARLEEVPEIAAAIRADLDGWDNRSVKDELDILRRYAGQKDEDAGASPAPAKPPARTGGRARTTFQLARPQGSAKCVAANGRLEIRLPRDFSSVDRRRLEAAVAAFLDQIEG